MPTAGEPSAKVIAALTGRGGEAREHESIEAERTELASDVKDILAEAKSAGFDLRAIRQIVRLRRQDKDERNARQAVVDEYLEALGDYASTSLGKAAMERAGSFSSIRRFWLTMKGGGPASRRKRAVQVRPGGPDGSMA